MVPFKPVLNELTDFRSFLATAPVRDASACIAHCLPDDKKRLSEIYRRGQHALILIGPEGDFTPAEINQALEKGFSPVSLGPNRLRTETAGVVACHTVHVCNE
jgi:16S rRNA (uracil1498-N3)-methyltransferase